MVSRARLAHLSFTTNKVLIWIELFSIVIFSSLLPGLGGNGAGGSTCKAMCMFGGTCVNGKCECTPGYQGEYCTERK